ncbi:MAG: MFS transporter [Betaproteobacteria bacterium]
MFWAKLFFPFAGAYFLSYHFRTANAVIGPILSEELTLGAADLGLLTSAYFIAFGAAQLPLGLLLDRFGARRVESAMLLFAAAGAAVFASGHSIGTLTIGRGMIGLGVSACLMAAFKSFSLWFPKEKQASLTGWIMTAGTLGALAASAPLDAALHFASWRIIFFALSLATLAMSAWLFFGVPDEPGTAKPEPLAVQLAGIRYVLANRHFWRYAPLGFAQIGGFMAVQSLWSSAWLIHVNGYSRSQAADHLAAMSLAMIIAYALIGLLSTGLARRGIGTIYLLGGAMAMSLLTLFMIISQSFEQHYLLWIAYGAFSSFGTLLYTQTASGFPVTLSGRANTTLNLLVFLGAFSLQWGMGIMIDLLLANGFSPQIAHRHAFSALFILQAAAYLWLLIGGRRPAT